MRAGKKVCRLAGTVGCGKRLYNSSLLTAVEGWVREDNIDTVTCAITYVRAGEATQSIWKTFRDIGFARE